MKLFQGKSSFKNHSIRNSQAVPSRELVISESQNDKCVPGPQCCVAVTLFAALVSGCFCLNALAELDGRCEMEADARDLLLFVCLFGTNDYSNDGFYSPTEAGRNPQNASRCLPSRSQSLPKRGSRSRLSMTSYPGSPVIWH